MVVQRGKMMSISECVRRNFLYSLTLGLGGSVNMSFAELLLNCQYSVISDSAFSSRISLRVALRIYLRRRYTVFIDQWHTKGGVLIMGYEMYRMIALYKASLCNSVTNSKGKKKKKARSFASVIDIDEEEKEMKRMLGKLVPHDPLKSSLTKPSISGRKFIQIVLSFAIQIVFSLAQIAHKRREGTSP